jgi:hypothetical protein
MNPRLVAEIAAGTGVVATIVWMALGASTRLDPHGSSAYNDRAAGTSNSGTQVGGCAQAKQGRRR